jgi:chloramphenicol-sensitive protein RarD
MNRGLLYGIVAYLLWGLFPVYWKLLDHIPPGEILANRIVWSFVFLVILLGLRRQWTWVRALRRDRKTIGTLVAAGGLLAVNWFTYIWGVNNGYIVETSLGYFINPMVSVLLGVLVLGERLRRVQKFAVAVAALGVIYLTVGYGSLPWIALTLAFSFGFYGHVLARYKWDGAAKGRRPEYTPALDWEWCCNSRTAALFCRCGSQDPIVITRSLAVHCAHITVINRRICLPRIFQHGALDRLLYHLARLTYIYSG